MSANAKTVAECVRIEVLHGYVLGFVQPSCVADLHLSDAIDPAALARRLRASLAPHLPSERADIRPALTGVDAWIALGIEIAVAAAGIAEASGIPVVGTVRVVRITSGSSGVRDGRALKLAIPSHVPQAAARALRWVVEEVNALAGDTQRSERSPELINGLEAAVATLVPFAPRGSNNVRFIRAAHEAGIPVIRLPGDVHQYGWGHRGRWFKSSITDETSTIATLLTKNKALTNATLRLAGIPVPEGALVADEAAAVDVADRLGYPVVVKPADRDQGMGVSVDLRDAQAVRCAFRGAIEYSRNVLVERHVRGTAFRITVFRGRSAAVVMRRPAGVTGDGVSTVDVLVAKVNQDPRRSLSAFSIMKPIVIDDEARELLAELNMDSETIPAAGRFVALKRAANVSTGGDVIVLDASGAHPSYALLAERVSKLLRLDVSAVDFVTTDILGPWDETGTAIIEVNAQPQMGTNLTHIHGQLLRQYVDGDGTIPSVIVIGTTKDEFVRGLRDVLCERSSGARLGTVCDDGVFIGAERVCRPTSSALGGVTALLVDPSVTALLLATDPRQLRRAGLPLPRVDHLVLAGPPEDTGRIAAMLALISPHLRGNVFLEQNNPCRNLVGSILGSDRMLPLGSMALISESIAGRLTEVSPQRSQWWTR